MTVSGGDHSGPLMTMRTALILTISLLAGLGTGALLQWSGRHPAEALIGGIGVFIAALKLLHQWIAPDRPGGSKEH